MMVRNWQPRAKLEAKGERWAKMMITYEDLDQ